MTVNVDNLSMGVQRGIFRNHDWWYDTTDSLATMNTAGYWNGCVERGMQLGDRIHVTLWTTAVPTGGHPATADAITGVYDLIVVNADLENDVVDVADGTTISLTDSD